MSARLDAQAAPSCRAELVRRSFLRRVIRLSGEVEALVEYDGRGLGYESVLVDGTAASRRPSNLWFGPRFDFPLPAPHGAVPACLEVRISLCLHVRAMRLTVGGRCVYAEGAPWSEAAPPVPAPAAGAFTDAPGSSTWRATLLRRAWFYRLLRLDGPALVTLEYNARRLGYEEVRVNGRMVPPRWNWGTATEVVCPVLEFTIPGNCGEVPVRLEASAASFAGLSGFRLTVDGVVVYAEGGGLRGSLPVPASPPPPPEHLPVVSPGGTAGSGRDQSDRRLAAKNEAIDGDPPQQVCHGRDRPPSR